MTNWQLTFETDASNLDEVFNKLEAKLNPAGLAAWLSATVDPFLRHRTVERFNSEGDDVSGAWHPLTKATQIMREEAGYAPDGPINIRTSKMRASLVYQSADVKPNGIGATLTYPGPIGNAEVQEKIKTAQMGKANPRTPPRPVLGMNENDLLFITSSLVAWLAEDYL